MHKKKKGEPTFIHFPFESMELNLIKKIGILPVRIVNKLCKLPSAVSYHAVAVISMLKVRTAKYLPIYQELL